MTELESLLKVLSRIVTTLCFALSVLAIPIASVLIASGTQPSTSIAVGAFAGIGAAGYLLPGRSVGRFDD